MSMYSNNSQQYWNCKKKKNGYKDYYTTTNIMVILLFILLAFIASSIYNKSDASAIVITTAFEHTKQRKDKDIKNCIKDINKYNNNKNNEECSILCNNDINNKNELKSSGSMTSQLLQRRKDINPRMSTILYQSCYHGCNVGYKSSLEIGCNSISNEGDGYEIVNSNDEIKDGYNECLKYQNILPKPDIFTVCREYYITGTKKGFKKGKFYYDNKI